MKSVRACVCVRCDCSKTRERIRVCCLRENYRDIEETLTVVVVDTFRVDHLLDLSACLQHRIDRLHLHGQFSLIFLRPRQLRLKTVQRVLRFVSVKEADAPEILPKLRLHADLYQIVLKQNTIILTDKPVKC